jgi:putative effector of murein hydrolase
VTTPIAMKLSEEIGGEEDLTAGIVIVTGILGAMFGPEFLRRLRVKSRLAVGLAVGTASHGIGTARMEEEDRHYGDDEGKAASMIGMILNGVVTALIIHWCLLIMGISVPQN